MITMTNEQMDHFLRHVKMHAEEVRLGTFSKEPQEYISKLIAARQLALEISHDMIHIMRIKQFEGYENADFQFDTFLPNNWQEHEFHTFDSTSFIIGCKIRSNLDYGMIDEKNIILSCSDAENQLEILANSIQDASVLIEMLLNN